MGTLHDGSFLSTIVHHLFTVIPSRWKRRRLFGPQQVLVCVMHLSVIGKRTYRSTLGDLFASMRRALRWSRIPSRAAFSQARKKLSRSTCRQAFKDIVALCPGSGLEMIRYSGYRVVAMDATKAILPSSDALRERFGCPTTTTEAQVPQALLTVLWDVSRHRPIDWRMGSWRASERLAAFSLLRNLGPGDLVLADRGHPSRKVFIALHRKNTQFLMRMCTDRSASKQVHAFIASGQDDALVDLRLHRKPQRLAHGSDTLTVRLIRQELAAGEVAVYVTSLLDQGQHPRLQLIALYAKRWRLETAFRDMKLGHNLELLRSRFVRGVHQEITGIMIYLLLASEFEALARTRLGKPFEPQLPGRPHQVQDCGVRLNHGALIDAVATTLVVAVTEPQQLKQQIEQQLNELWRYRSAIRPNRSYPRRAKSPNSKWRGGRSGGWA